MGLKPVPLTYINILLRSQPRRDISIFFLKDINFLKNFLKFQNFF